MASHYSFIQQYKIKDIIQATKELVTFRCYHESRTPLTDYLDMHIVTSVQLDKYARVARYIGFDVRKEQASKEWYEGDINLNKRYGVKSL